MSEETTTQPKIFDIGVIAVICHEANKSLCERTGDLSQKSWNEAADWQRESAIKGVEFALANPDGSPEDQHNSWMKEKEEAGWVFGPVKDEVEKTHPCMVPYEELPAAQRAKDVLFKAIVKALSSVESEGEKEKKSAAKKAAAKKD